MLYKSIKKIIIYTLLAMGTTASAFAQKDAEARAILNKVSHKYHSYNIVKSDFAFDIEDQQQHVRESKQGTLIVRAKTNEYKLTLFSPGLPAVLEQELISDGKSQWYYLIKDKEVQLSKVDNSAGNFNPVKIFTIYEKGYKYIYTGNETLNGRVCQVIDLTPEQEKDFYKIRLWIDKDKKEMSKALIFDKNGSKITYTIKTFAPDNQITENVFTYNPKEHPGIEVVDLR
jgi:outer membrane lipoprotein-sorting protein